MVKLGLPLGFSVSYEPKDKEIAPKAEVQSRIPPAIIVIDRDVLYFVATLLTILIVYRMAVAR